MSSTAFRRHPSTAPATPSPGLNPDAARLPAGVTRLSMSRVILAWAFGAVFFQLSAGAVYASFARQLGVSEATFGFLAGVSPLMGFLQLPAARLLESGFSPRKLMLLGGLIGRSLWVVAASLPLLESWNLLPQAWVLPGFVLCVVVSSIGQALTGPSFFVWMSALVPGRVGPSFWARRQQIGTIVAIFAVLAGGAIADQAGAIKAWSHDQFPPVLVYSALLSLAAVCGVMDIALFFGVQEPPALRSAAEADADHPSPVGPTLLSSLLEPLRERQVRNYLAFTAVAMVGFASTGPLLWLHCLEFFDWNKKETGLLLTVAPLLGAALSARFWGRVARDYGTRPMARLASVGLVVIPVAWLLATPNSFWPMAVIICISGMLTTAYDMCNMQFVTRSSPHLPRPTLTALFAIAAGISFALSAWGCGVAAQWLDGWRMDLWGHKLINYHLIYLFSLVPRLLNAFVFAPRLEEPAAAPTRAAVREIGLSLAEAVTSRFSRISTARQE